MMDTYKLRDTQWPTPHALAHRVKLARGYILHPPGDARLRQRLHQGAILLPIVGAASSTQLDLVGFALILFGTMALDKRFERAYLVWSPIAPFPSRVMLVETAAIVARRPQRRPLERPAATHQNRNARLLHRRRQEGHLVDLKIVAIVAEWLAAP